MALSHGVIALARQPPFPRISMADNGVEVLELWPPVELRADAIDIGYQGRRIAGAPAGNFDRKIAPTDAPHRVDHFKH